MSTALKTTSHMKAANRLLLSADRLVISGLFLFITIVPGFVSAAPNFNLGDYQIRVFQHPNYSGQFADYTIPAGKSQLLVPQLPPNLNDQITSIALGPKVGVAVFSHTNYMGEDKNLVSNTTCAPYIWNVDESWKLIDKSEPKFIRVDESPVFDRDRSYGLDDRISSLVLYKKDSGGFFAAEITGMGRHMELTGAFEGGTCEYARQFFPISREDGARCFEIAPTSWSWKHWLLMHGKFSANQNISVDLFAEPGCKGNSIHFPDPARVERGYYLNDYHWENLPKSIRVALVSGVAGAISAQWIEPGGERRGAAIQTEWSSAKDAAECRQRCDSDGLCRSYSHLGYGVSGRANQSLCQLNKDEPAYSNKGAGFTSGMKRFKPKTERQVFVNPAWGGSPLNWCLAASGGCGEVVAKHYCKAQGFRTADSFDKDKYNNFGKIACGNALTIQGVGQAKVINQPSQVATQPKGSSAPAPALARCDQYAREAIAQQEENVEFGCNLHGPEWNPDYQAHYRWCETVSPDKTAAGSDFRRNALDKCHAAQTPAAAPAGEDRCTVYATTAVNQQQENLSRNCNFSGPEWNTDYRAHFNWCQQVDKSYADAGTLLRQAALGGCK